MPSKSTRRGLMSRSDMAYVEKHAGRKSAEQMAAYLNRSVKQVQDYIDALQGAKPEVTRVLTEELQHRPEWVKFRKQFTPSELETFKYRYVQLMAQFKDDILPTEELQIFNVITLELLIDRTLEEQKASLDTITRASRELERATTVVEGEKPDIKVIDFINSQLETAKTSNKVCAERYKIYTDKQSSLLKELKGTRDQRIKLIEDSKQSFTALLRLLAQQDKAEAAGYEAELQRMAWHKEEERLSSVTEYDDGAFDLPLLTPETVDRLEPNEE